jgi:hypothetical protein
MASDSGETEDQIEGSHGPRECMPCRGTGQVISGLGGEPSKITCPWCAGGGVRLPDTDAQAKWPANETPIPPVVADAASAPAS